MSKKPLAARVREYLIGKDFLTVAEIAQGLKVKDEYKSHIGSHLGTCTQKGITVLSKYYKTCTVTGRDVKAYKLAESKKTASIAPEKKEKLSHLDQALLLEKKGKGKGKSTIAIVPAPSPAPIPELSIDDQIFITDLMRYLLDRLNQGVKSKSKKA